MPDKTELRARRDFRQAALSRLRTAYIKLVDGGVKSYMIDDRQLTRLDHPSERHLLSRHQVNAPPIHTRLVLRNARE